MPTLGWHWMARASQCPTPTLEDPERIRDVLLAVVLGLGLHAVSQPTVRRTDSGVAGVVLLAESHLAIHTVATAGDAFVDLFSCVPFDHTAAAALILEALAAEGIDGQLVERGT